MKIWLLFTIPVLMLSCKSSGNDQAENNTSSGKYLNTTSTMKTIIVDVRTKEEWEDGHASCSVNIPMDKIMSKTDELRKYDSVILVCRSGNRASHVQSQLHAAGFRNVQNKGAWQNIQCQ